MPDSILYYPSIEFRSPEWVKSALLVWDHVYRIVPANYRPTDSPLIREAVYRDRVRNIVLEEDDVARTGDDFLTFCDSLPFIPAGLDARGAQRIHPDKIDERLYPALNRIASEFEQEGWLRLTPAVARGYMFFLASHVAERRSLARGTDDPDVWSVDPFFSENANFGELLHVPDAERFYCSLFVRELIPADVASLSMEQVIDFAEQRRDERVELRDALSTAIAKVARCESAEYARELANDELAHFERAKEQYRKSAGWWNEGTVGALFVVGVPVALTALSVFGAGKSPFDLASISPSLSVAAVAAYYESMRVRRSSRKLSAASYLVDLDKRTAGGRRIPRFDRILDEFVND